MLMAVDRLAELSLVPSLGTTITATNSVSRGGHGSGEQAVQRHCTPQAGHDLRTHDIFEGTEQIQQLVISRAISGMRVE
jgi:alkylation response protein AidB-like acyl-CoA dehydrogenase